MISKEWKKRLAYDFLGLGSIIFYIIVLARAFIGPYWNFILQLVISGIIILILSLFFKESDYYLARAAVLVVFTALFYNEIKFSIFVIILYLLIISSAAYLKKSKKTVLSGLFLGIISALLGYLLTPSIGRFFNLGV